MISWVWLPMLNESGYCVFSGCDQVYATTCALSGCNHCVLNGMVTVY